MTVTETKAKLAEVYDGYHFAHDVEGVYQMTGYHVVSELQNVAGRSDVIVI
jgi:hypothetical protein